MYLANSRWKITTLGLTPQSFHLGPAVVRKARTRPLPNCRSNAIGSLEARYAMVETSSLRWLSSRTHLSATGNHVLILTPWTNGFSCPKKCSNGGRLANERSGAFESVSGRGIDLCVRAKGTGNSPPALV